MHSSTWIAMETHSQTQEDIHTRLIAYMSDKEVELAEPGSLKTVCTAWVTSKTEFLLKTFKRMDWKAEMIST